jgi:hypothetical protein
MLDYVNISETTVFYGRGRCGAGGAGRGCSYVFLKAFVQLCFDLVQNQMSIQISQDYSSMVNFARCKVLGANVSEGT